MIGVNGSGCCKIKLQPEDVTNKKVFSEALKSGYRGGGGGGGAAHLISSEALPLTCR